MLIPRPTNESQPSASDIATASGTSVSDSSSTPTTDDIIMHTKTMTANRRYFFFSNFLTTEDIIYLSTPLRSRIRNVPPMRTMNTTIPIPVVICDEVNTIIGARIIFHHGIFPSSPANS